MQKSSPKQGRDLRNFASNLTPLEICLSPKNLIKFWQNYPFFPEKWHFRSLNAFPALRRLCWKRPPFPCFSVHACVHLHIWVPPGSYLPLNFMNMFSKKFTKHLSADMFRKKKSLFSKPPDFFFFFCIFRKNFTVITYLYNNSLGNSIFLEREAILCCSELIIASDNSSQCF